MELHPPKPEKKAILKGKWKLIVSKSGEGDLSLELFDLEADPNEIFNLARKEEQRVSKLHEELKQITSRQPPRPAPRGDVEVSQELIEQLKSVGYVEPNEGDE